MSIVAGVIQVCAGPDKEANLAKARTLVEQAVRQAGAQLVALPEVFAWRGPPADEAGVAEPMDGPIITQMRALARDLRICLLVGSFLERSPDDQRPFNTSVMIAPDGEILATYRKIHLFDVLVPGHGAVQESATRAPGSRAVVTRLPLDGLSLGLSVCYDLRFPELYRNLAFQGAQMLAVPAAFTARTGRDHWLALLRARAIENLCYVIAPNQWGVGGERMDTYGRSAIVDPWGTVLATCPDAETFVTAPIDLGLQARVRETFPALNHVRRDLFWNS